MEHISLEQFLQYIVYNKQQNHEKIIFILVFTLMAGLLCSCHTNKVFGDGNVGSGSITKVD